MVSRLPFIRMVAVLAVAATGTACYTARAVHPSSLVVLDRSPDRRPLVGVDGGDVAYHARDSLVLTRGAVSDEVRIRDVTARPPTGELIVDDPDRGTLTFRTSDLTAVHVRRPTVRVKNPGLVAGTILLSALVGGIVALSAGQFASDYLF